MKRFYFIIAIMCIALLTSCTKDYRLVFGLGDDIKDVENKLKELNVTYTFDEDKDFENVTHLETEEVAYDGTVYDIIKAMFLNGKVVYMNYYTLEGDEGDIFLLGLKEKFGEPTQEIENKDYDVIDNIWGDTNSRFCIVKRNTLSSVFDIFLDRYYIQTSMGNTDIDNPYLSNEIRKRCFDRDVE